MCYCFLPTHWIRLSSLIRQVYQILASPSIDGVAAIAAGELDLHIDFANGVVVGARGVHPFGDVTVRSTVDVRNVDVAGGVVVAILLATVVNGDVGSALGGRNGVRERHTTECRISTALNRVSKARLAYHSG